MIDEKQRVEILKLVDALRLRGVHTVGLQTEDLKLEVHMAPLAPGELPQAWDAKDDMLKEPSTTPEQRAKIEQEQADRDLFNDRNPTDEDDDG